MTDFREFFIKDWAFISSARRRFGSIEGSKSWSFVALLSSHYLLAGLGFLLLSGVSRKLTYFL